jgi:signal transduction histidine kinase
MSAGVAERTPQASIAASGASRVDGRRRLAPLLGRLRRGWRGAAFPAALAVSAALVALTGVQIAQRTTADRAAVGEALQTVALHLTQSLGRQIDADRQHLLSLVLAPVQQGDRAVEAPTASELATSVRERFTQLGLRPDGRMGTFRVALGGAPDARVDATGAMGDGATAEAVLRAVARLAPALHARPLALQHAEVRVGRTPVDLHVAVQRGADGTPRAVYGVTLTHGHLVRELGARAARTLPMPVSFLGRDWRTGARVDAWMPAGATTPGLAPASERRTLRATVRRSHPGADGGRHVDVRPVASPIDLFALQVRDTVGRVLYATPGVVGSPFATPAAPFVAEYDDPALGLVIGAALDGAHGERLVSAIVGPVARTQWLLGGVAALGACFVAGVMLQLRRRHQLVEARRDFVAAISHELRTPLAHMALLSETLLVPARGDEEAQRARWLGVIHREAIRLGRLVDNVLLHVRGEHGGHAIDRAWLDLEDVMDDVLASMELAADARAVRLAADYPGDLMVHADMGALRQVLLNLIDNAIKHGPDGQTVAVTVAIEPATATRAPCVVLTVDDEGPGIAPSDRGRVWRPFVRLGDRGGATGGSGLGLSVVRDLVQQHGGRVELRESPGGGVRAVVSLPQPRALAG